MSVLNKNLHHILSSVDCSTTHAASCMRGHQPDAVARVRMLCLLPLQRRWACALEPSQVAHVSAHEVAWQCGNAIVLYDLRTQKQVGGAS